MSDVSSAVRVLVTGANGNVGREVVRALAAKGISVRVGVRDGAPRPVAYRVDVERVRFDFSDPKTFGPALAGCSALFLLRPPAISDVARTLVPLVRAARPRHIVFLSVAGAETNAWVPHHAVEAELLAAPEAPSTILRPGFFAQNLESAYLRDITEDGRLYVPAGRGKVAFVDVRDLAEVAALAFSEPDVHAGKAYTLTGPRAVGMAEVAAILTRANPRAIRYVPASVPGYLHHLVVRRRLPIAQAIVQTVLHVGLRFGQAERVDRTLGTLLGAPPRTIEAYVADHAALFARRPA